MTFPVNPAYARLQSSATRMIAAYGQPVTLQQMGPAVYDPTKGVNTPTMTTYLGQGAFLDFSMSAPSVTTIRGTEIQQGDKRLFLSMQATLAGAPVKMPQPNPDDSIIDSNGVVYNVLASTTVNPTGQLGLVHEIHVRGVATA